MLKSLLVAATLIASSLLTVGCQSQPSETKVYTKTTKDVCYEVAGEIMDKWEVELTNTEMQSMANEAMDICKGAGRREPITQGDLDTVKQIHAEITPIYEASFKRQYMGQ